MSDGRELDIRMHAADRAARSRLSVLASVMAVGWLGFALQYAMQGRWKTVAIDLAVAATGLGIRAWALADDESRRIPLGAHLNLAASAVGLTAAAILSGQTASMAVWWLACAPLVAAYQLGSRAAVVWALIASVLVACVHASEAVARVEPEFVPVGGELLLGRVALVAVVLAFAIAARRIMDAHVARVEAHEMQVEKYAEVLKAKTLELEQARDAALAAARAKSEFLANMSHEIRTPLNGVLGLLPLMDDPDVDRAEIIHTMRSSGSALLTIVDDILELSKMEAGQVHVKSVHFDVRDCVADVTRLLKPAAVNKGLDLHVDLDENLPRSVEADAIRLKQVLVNLVGNAIKFTSAGRVTVSATSQRDRLQFDISDTGIGIPAEARKKLFQPFTQLDASATRRHGGTGLGLSISRRLVALMGGTMSVTSKVGRGSTFHFAIPIVEREEEAPRDEPLSATRIKPSSTPLCVLVADDDPLNLRVATRLLSKLGHSPDVASNGQQVLAAIDKKAYDIIFMDLHMPDIDGAETTRRIRGREVESGQPFVVALTASVLDEQRDLCRAAGMNDFVTKPVQLETLAAVLDDAQKRKREARSA